MQVKPSIQPFFKTNFPDGEWFITKFYRLYFWLIHMSIQVHYQIQLVKIKSF